MVVKEIEIKNFRNINFINYKPSENINFFIGDNAQGKTNFIESIYFIAFGKSFRTNNLRNLLNDKKKALIKFIILHNNVNYDVKVEIDKNKIIKINNKISKIKEISKFFKVVLYYPSEINFLLKSPSLRRNLIDKSIFLHDVNYIDFHLDYIKCLKNRNLCLKSNKDNYIWTEKLIDLSYEIVKKRIFYIEEMNKIFSENNNLIIGEKYNIKYKKIDLENYKFDLKKDFEKNKKNENNLGYTLFGQHTDQISFYINNVNLDNYGSEGQKKTFLLFYKYAQLLNFSKKENYKPVLIIDDATSEIDNKRENILINNLLSNCDQSFITSLKKPSFYKEGDNVILVNNGKIFDDKENS